MEDEVIYLAKDYKNKTSVFSFDGKSIKNLSTHFEYPKDWIDKMVYSMIDDEYFENERMINYLLKGSSNMEDSDQKEDSDGK